MQPTTPPPAQKVLRIVFMVALADAGSFDLGTLDVPVLTARQFLAAVSLTFVPWRFLFPGLCCIATCAIASKDKLLENLTKVLTDRLPTYKTPNLTDSTAIQLAVERRIFQFITQCVRLIFCSLPFFAFLALTQAFLNSALTVAPH